MFMKSIQIAPARMASLLGAVETAARRIPPAFPLEATVAVNPFLGQTSEDLATAAARLNRVAGINVTQARSVYGEKVATGEISQDDLAAALAACESALAPPSSDALIAALSETPQDKDRLPSVADLAAQALDSEWYEVIDLCIGLWEA
mgnify:CR=1 FL=1